MKKLLYIALMPLALAAGELKIEWSGKGNEKLKIPARAEMMIENNRSYVRCTPVESRPWQGLTGKFAEPVDLSKYRGVAFEFRQKFYAGNPAVVFYINTPGGAIYTDFSGGKGKWTKVEIPFDTRIWKGSEKLGFTQATQFTVYPYSNLDSPKKSLEIANVRFLPKEAGNTPRKIAVRSYKINATPTDGPDPGDTLTDGKSDVDIHFRGYGNVEPVFTFDLGTIHAVTSLKLVASGKEYAQNFRSADIHVSNDGKKFFPAGSISNARMEKTRQVYSMSVPFAARYVKISPIRSRQDFPIRISEVVFTGYIPSGEELAKFSEHTYDEGIPLPKDNGGNYVSVKSGDYSFKVCKDNGILTDIRFKGELVALKHFSCYVMSFRKKDVVTNALSNRISNFTVSDNGVKYTAVNAKLPGVVMNYEFLVDESGIVTKLSVDDQAVKDKAFLRISYETVFDKNFRRGGYYESWGGHHRLERFAASEIVSEKAIDGAATLSFERAGGKQTLLVATTNFNGHELPLGSSVEDRSVQCFLANGIRMGAVTVNLGNNKSETVFSLWMMSDGTLLDAYDKYTQRKEFAELNARIPRASWLRDAKMSSNLGGWEGGWIGGLETAAENLTMLYEYDPIISGMLNGMGRTWGDFYYGEGEAPYGFGERTTGKAMRERYQNLRKINPNLKVGVYNWLWSAGTNSDIFAKHPDWFVTKTREGSTANYFPGAEIILNFLRKFSNEASRQDAVDTICGQMNAFDLDIFYLDGGSVGAYAQDWENMEMDEMTCTYFLHDEIRTRMMKDNPERAVFFNVPFNPQGDFGFLESFSDIVSNWRNGALNMYKFKIFQHKNPLHYPIYIYWIGTTNGPLEEYMIGTGLFASTHSRGDRVGDVGYISGRFEVRQLAMVEAGIKPNWRFDEKTDIETMPMKQADSAFIFIKNHAKEAKTENISFDTAPFGFVPGKPVYCFLTEVKNANDYECSFGEPELRKAYENHNWISDRVTIPRYAGVIDFKGGRISQDLKLPGNTAMLYTLSQVPAVVWSYRGHPTYHRISGNPGIAISGDYGNLTVRSEKENSEIAIIIPENKIPDSVTVNGVESAWNYFQDNGVLLAVVKIAQAGTSQVAITFKDAEKLEGKPELTLRRSGYNLRCKLTVPESYIGKKLVFSISDGINPAYGKTIDLVVAEMSFTVKLPVTVLDGKYRVTAFVPGNEAVTKVSTIRALARKTRLKTIMPAKEIKSEVKDCSVSAGGMDVSRMYKISTDVCSGAEVDPQKLAVKVRTFERMASYWNKAAGALELNNVKRYIKLELKSNLWYFNVYSSCASGRHSPRHETPSHYIGLFFDFGTAKGYTVRAAGGLGKYNIKNDSVLFPYGANCLPQHMWMLNDMMARQDLKEEVIWLDLWALGAPANWDNRLLISAVLTHCSASREVSFRILETADELPAGAKCAEPLSLLKQEPPKTIQVPRVSGTPDEKAWKNIPVAGEMFNLINRAVKPEYPILTRVAHDGQNIYLHWDIKDVKGKVFDCREGDIGRPFFSDSVEVILELKDDPDMFIQIVVDAKGNSFYQKSTINPEKKSRQKKLTGFPVVKKLNTADTSHWQVMMTVPLKSLGVKSVSGSRIFFNMMHNRVNNGIMENYSLAPKYYSGNHHTLELK